MAVAKKKRTAKKAAKKKTTKKAAKKKTTKKAAAKKKTTKKAAKKKTTKKKTAAKKKAVKKKTAAKKKTTKKAAKKKTAKKTAKKTTRKKTAKKKTGVKRKPNPAFMKPMTPSADLAAVVGSKAMPRTEITKKLWAYIKKNGLQDARNRRMINADDKLKKVFGGKKQVSMFDMTKHVSKHLKG